MNLLQQTQKGLVIDKSTAQRELKITAVSLIGSLEWCTAITQEPPGNESYCVCERQLVTFQDVRQTFISYQLLLPAYYSKGVFRVFGRHGQSLK